MVKILVGSKNPVKINSVKQAFSHYFGDVEVEGKQVPSNVPDQPFEEQTYQGAKNRAQNLKIEFPDYDFYVGLEAGISKTFNNYFTYGIIYILDKNGKESFGSSPQYPLPSKIMQKVLAGGELGPVMAEMFAKHDIKTTSGAVGVFTKDVVSRTDLYVPGVIMALISFLNPELFFEK